MINVKKQLIQYKIQKFIAENNIVLFSQYTRVNVKEWQILQKEFSKHGKINTFSVKSKIAHRFVISDQTYTNLKQNTCFNCDKKNHHLSGRKKFTKNINDWVPHQAKNIVSSPPGSPKIFNGSFPSQPLSGYFFDDLKKRHLFLLKNFKTKDSFFFEKKIVNTSIELFQGPTLLLGCNSQKELFKVYHLIVKAKVLSSFLLTKNLKPKNLLWLHGKKKIFRNDKILIGGIYEKKALTHLDINKLGHLDETAYATLIALWREKISLFMHSHIGHYQQNLVQLLI